MLELEGTWEEIIAHAAELAGRRVRVTVLDAGESGREEEDVAAVERFRAAMRELESSDQDMLLTPAPPGGDAVALVREARSGFMYGCDPAE
jgi:hypothetical protein